MDGSGKKSAGKGKRSSRMAGGGDRGLSRTAKKKTYVPVSREEAISRIPFFSNLTKNELKRIASYFHECRFARNRYLFMEGEPAERFYVIKYGRVKLLKTATSGKEMVLDVMVPGQICGGNALFGDTHRNSAQAVEPTLAYGMSGKSYKDLLSANPKIAQGIIKYLGAKLMDAHDVIISLVSSKVESRIASVIVRLCENHGTETDGGILINIRLTRQDIADIVGSTVETTIRTISKFKKQGLLTTVGGRLLVKDIDAFRNMMK
jgi:CRP/FNR family transcriptional regulator